MQKALSLPNRSHDSQFVGDALFLINVVDRQCAGLPLPDTAKTRLQKGIAMPQNFLLELSAVAYVGYWERSSHKRYLAKEFPTYQEAFEALKCRVLTAPERFFEIETFEENGLFAKTLETYFLSYSQSTELGCQLLVGQVDEDILVEAIASLLMNHRHQLGTNDQQRKLE